MEERVLSTWGAFVCYLNSSGIWANIVYKYHSRWKRDKGRITKDLLMPFGRCHIYTPQLILIYCE